MDWITTWWPLIAAAAATLLALGEQRHRLYILQRDLDETRGEVRALRDELKERVTRDELERLRSEIAGVAAMVRGDLAVIQARIDDRLGRLEERLDRWFQPCAPAPVAAPGRETRG